MKITQGARILAASEKVDQDNDQDIEMYIYSIRNVTKNNVATKSPSLYFINTSYWLTYVETTVQLFNPHAT